MADVAALLSEVSEQSVKFVDETLQEAYASRAHYGAPQCEVERMGDELSSYRPR